MKPKPMRKRRRPSRRTTDAMKDAVDADDDLKILMGLCVQGTEATTFSCPEARAAAALTCFLVRTQGCVDDPALLSLLGSCVEDTDWMDVADYVTEDDPVDVLRHRMTGDEDKTKSWIGHDHPEYARWTERRPPASISYSR